MWMHTERLLGARSPQPPQPWLLSCAGSATTRLQARSALQSRMMRNRPQAASPMLLLRCLFRTPGGGLQVFNVNGVVGSDSYQGSLVIEVAPLAPYCLLVLGDQHSRLLATPTSLLPPRQALSRFGQPLLPLAVVTGFSTASPSAAVRNARNPLSIPVSRPVRVNGWVGASAQEKDTYQPATSS